MSNLAAFTPSRFLARSTVRMLTPADAAAAWISTALTGPALRRPASQSSAGFVALFLSGEPSAESPTADALAVASRGLCSVMNHSHQDCINTQLIMAHD